MNEIKGKFISDIPLFKDIITQKTQSKILQQMQECLFSPGEVIFQHHDNDDCAIYYVLKGQVKISLEDQVHRTVRLIEKKGCFGEISFITGNERVGTATATDFCRIYKIKRDDFYQIIKENDQDFENFQMLYEAVCLKGNLKFAKMYCYSCKRGDHLAQTCPKTHLILSKQILIQKLNKTQPIAIRTYQTRRKAKLNSRLMCHQIQDALINIHSHQEYAEVIEIIEELAHLNDSYLELYYGDEEQSNYDAISNQYNFNNKESFKDKYQDKQQSVNERAPSSHHSAIDKNDLTPSQSSSEDSDDDEEVAEDDDTSPYSSHDTTTLEQNSVSEFSSHKKKKTSSKRTNSTKSKQKRSNKLFAKDMTENIIEEQSDDSAQDTHAISNGTKFGNKMVKISQKFCRESDLSAISMKEGNNEDVFQQIDDQSRKYFKEFEEEFSVRYHQDNTPSKSSLRPSKSFSALIANQNIQIPIKRKSLHQEVLEKQYNQIFNESEGVQMGRNNMSSVLGGIDRQQQSQTVLSNNINANNQSIAGFNDINISANNLDDNGIGVREKKSNSFSAAKYKLDESSLKQTSPHYRKSVSFDPNYFIELQRNYLKKQISGSLNKNSTRSIEESNNKRYKAIQQMQLSSMSSNQKIPSGLKNLSSILALQYNHSSSNNVSGQPNSSLQRMSTRNFKRQSTKTNPRPSNNSFSSQQSNYVQGIPPKGIMKRGGEMRQQLQPQDLKIIQLNESKLKELYENQKQQYLNDDILNPAMYTGSKEEQDLVANQTPFDVIKKYVYYYPQFNVQNVLQNYHQVMNKAKQIKQRPTILSKNIKRIKRVINSKKIKGLVSNNVTNNVTNTGTNNAVIQQNICDAIQGVYLQNKSAQSISFNNTNIKTNLQFSVDKIITSSNINNTRSQYIFQNAQDQIKVSNIPQIKLDDSILQDLQ